MTARRGSLRYKIVSFARSPRTRVQRMSKTWRLAFRSAVVAGRSIAAVAILGVVATIGAQIWRASDQNMHLHRQIVQVQRQNESLERTTQNLTTRIQLLHDPEYVVPLIHEQLGLTKPHEIFVQVVPSPDK